MANNEIELGVPIDTRKVAMKATITIETEDHYAMANVISALVSRLRARNDVRAFQVKINGLQEAE